jgi:proteasome lid subunit RPN8/RPN11
MKVGYYEFEGKDRYPEEEETPVKPKRLKLKYKPRDFKEALLLKRLEEGDEQLIRQITDAELSSQGILRNDSEMPVIQQQGVDLKEHFDKIYELKEEIHKRDMQIIEERFSKGGANSGWESFSRMLESSAGKELGKEALETIREIFKTTKKDDYPDEGDEESFDEYKALPPAPDKPGPEKPGKDYASPHPGEALKGVILNNSATVIFLHNHPPGNPEPSNADREVHDR